MRDYLGKVSLTLDDIRKLSSSDQSHWLVLRETKTGSVELKIKVLSEECEVHITTFLFQTKATFQTTYLIFFHLVSKHICSQQYQRKFNPIKY